MSPTILGPGTGTRWHGHWACLLPPTLWQSLIPAPKAELASWAWSLPNHQQPTLLSNALESQSFKAPDADKPPASQGAIYLTQLESQGLFIPKQLRKEAAASRQQMQIPANSTDFDLGEGVGAGRQLGLQLSPLEVRGDWENETQQERPD